MLGGLAPILIFTFSKRIPDPTSSQTKIPLVSDVVNSVDFPPIPIYLSAELTGMYIDAEAKNIDAETSIESTTDASTPQVNQKTVNSVVTINMEASKDSIGVTLLSAMMDLVYQKLTSKEYQITYLNGAVTVFGGLLHSFAISQDANTDKYQISLQLVRNTTNTLPKAPIPVIGKTLGTVPL